MNKINDKWAKLILWAGSYLNVILFALIGGYYWLKTDREELKKECKKVLVVTLVFLAIDILVALIAALNTVFSFGALKFLTIFKAVVVVIKICTYVVCALFAFLGINVRIHKQDESNPSEVKEEEKIEA